ncbi:hypothetical protein [Mesorhizobium temperatum]|uniref:hypothetical protein n=1 Tax=Mesorhizobium temperatum TaxID=241416 RepID=UPI00117F82FF
MEPVEGTAVFNQLAAPPPRTRSRYSFRLLDVTMRLGVGDALVMQAGVQLLVGLEAQSRREEALARQPDLVLDLNQPEAGVQANQIMAAHLQEAAMLSATPPGQPR